MANSALTSVQFHGDTLSVTTINGAPYVAIKPITEVLGLDWKAQHSRINRHPVLSATMVVTTTVAEDGKQREMAALPLDKLNGWLFGVSVGRVKPELRERLTQYQGECFDVLAQHFGALKPPVSTLPSIQMQNPTDIPAMPFSIDTLLAFIASGLIDQSALLRIANESSMTLFKDVTNTKDAPWGEAVAAQINSSLPQADLRVIVNRAVMELFGRAALAAKTRTVPQRSQFAA